MWSSLLRGTPSGDRVGRRATSAAQAGASVLWVGILLVIYVVEIMVAAIQAYVFALLSAVYIQIAESDEE